MKKISLLLFVMLAVMSSLQLNAKLGEDIPAPRRANNYTSIPSYYYRLSDNSHMYYSIRERRLSGPMYQYAVSIIGEIEGRYFSSTFGNTSYDDGYGSGFLAALQVNNNTPVYVNSLDGTTNNDVTMTTRVEAQGEIAARIIYTLTNNSDADVTVQVGVYGDIMIGNDDEAALSRMMHNEDAYGLRLKGARQNGIDPIMSVLFGEGVTGVTPADDYWFGFFSSNWHANEIVGNYSSTIYNTSATYPSYYSQYYMVEAESGTYDSGMGFCWKNRTIPAGGSIELSYLVAVGEIDFEEPIIPDEPGQDIFTYEVEAYNFDAWNDLSVAHPAHIWGHYEHPYGQEGHIEYQVDDENTWHRIPTALVSGEDYDLPFDMFFNENRTTIHELKLRFNDGLDNIAELDGLEWEDVRNISLTVDPQTHVYNGEPQIFVVTVGGVIDYTLGENGEYTNPGTYSQSIWGVYEMETIGVNTVEFTVDKGQADVEIIVPGNVEYDGEAHGVIVNLLTGDTQPVVTYYQIDDDGTQHEIEGLPVEVGVYVVEVVVPESEFYYGTEESAGPYMIYVITGVEELNINGQDNGAWYTIDGCRVAAPTERGIYIHNGKKYIVK